MNRRAIQPEDRDAKLREPKTRMGILVRHLAEAAMSVTHHDASDDEPGYIHEVQAMERRFAALLRGKLRQSGSAFRDCAICGGMVDLTDAKKPTVHT